MLTKNATKEFKELYGTTENKIGRYRISGLYGILNGYTKPEQYAFPDSTIPELIRMRHGSEKHDTCQPILERWGYKTEVAGEMKYRDIVITGRADGLNDKEVIELKTSEKILSEAKKWHIFQLRWYLTMFNLPEGFVVQPQFNEKDIWLEVIGRVERNDDWVNKQLEKLYEFHKKLIK